MANPILDVLIDEITQTQGVLDSATAFVEGVPGLIEAAKQEALRNGATEAELAPFTALERELETKRVKLVAAIEASSGGGGGTPTDLRVDGASWDEGARTLTKSGAFAKYVHGSNFVFVPDTGTNVNTGVPVAIESKVGNDSLVLLSSITSGGASGMTDVGGVVRQVTPELAARAKARKGR